MTTVLDPIDEIVAYDASFIQHWVGWDFFVRSSKKHKRQVADKWNVCIVDLHGWPLKSTTLLHQPRPWVNRNWFTRTSTINKKVDTYGEDKNRQNHVNENDRFWNGNAKKKKKSTSSVNKFAEMIVRCSFEHYLSTVYAWMNQRDFFRAFRGFFSSQWCQQIEHNILNKLSQNLPAGILSFSVDFSALNWSQNQST